MLALLCRFVGLLSPLHCNSTPNATLAGALGGAFGTTPRLEGRRECHCRCAVVAAAEEQALFSKSCSRNLQPAVDTLPDSVSTDAFSSPYPGVRAGEGRGRDALVREVRWGRVPVPLRVMRCRMLLGLQLSAHASSAWTSGYVAESGDCMAGEAARRQPPPP